MQLKEEYQKLISQLINPGSERDVYEFQFNDGIYEAIETLFKDVDKELVKLIKLNHI